MGRDPVRFVVLEDSKRSANLKGLALDGRGIHRLHEALRSDPDLILAALPSYAKAIREAPQELQSDLGFAHEVVRRNWRSLEFLPLSVRGDRDVVMAAARQHGGAANFVSPELQKDPAFVGRMLQLDGPREEEEVAYWGEGLRLVGYCNNWRTSDSSLRFKRVVPGDAAAATGDAGAAAASSSSSPEAAETAGAAQAAASQAAAVERLRAAGSDVPEGVVRHRLTAHLSTGYLSFQVLSCLHSFKHRIYAKGGAMEGFFVMARRSRDGIEAGWAEIADTGHNCNFYIAEMAESVVNIYVDLFEGQKDVLSLPKVQVWYEIETCPEGTVVSLVQSVDKQKACLPKREARLLSPAPGQLVSNTVRVLLDPEASKKFDDLVRDARDLSRDNYAKRFYIRDLKGSKHLALLVDPNCTRTFGFCLYSVDSSSGELQLEQLVCSEALKPTLQAWVESQAEIFGQSLVERQGARRSMGLAPLTELWRRAGLSGPEEAGAFLVDRQAGAALRLTEKKPPDSEETGKPLPPYALLPSGTPLLGLRKQSLVHVQWPVPGFVDAHAVKTLQPDASVERRALATAELFAAMHRTRVDVTGPKPRGQCVISSHALCEDLVASSVDRQLGLGTCRVMEGSFLARLDTLAWERHWFVMFGNGSIADVTADQFDELTQLWYPADASRYALWVGDSQVPLSAIEAGGKKGDLRWASSALGWRPPPS